MKVRKALVGNVTSSKNPEENHTPQKRTSRKTMVRQLEENRGLVYYHANKWAASARRSGISIEDLIAAGELGLWYGTQKYDSEKGMSYPSYVTRCIKAYIKCEFNKLARHQARSLSEVLYENDNGEPITLEDILPGEDGSIEGLENKLLVKEILDYLNTEKFSEFDRKIFQMHRSFGIWEGEKPLSLSGIKEELNLKISKEAIRKRINKVQSRIRLWHDKKQNKEEVVSAAVAI